MMSSTTPTETAQGASCSPAMAESGATVYSRPDVDSSPVAKLAVRTQVCADRDEVGFGFRRVKLNDGKQGYVREGELNI
jgi:hypothetical protein